jgi:hypothetical protein
VLADEEASMRGTVLDCEIGVPVNLKAYTGADVTIVASAILGRNAVRISVTSPGSDEKRELLAEIDRLKRENVRITARGRSAAGEGRG